MSFGSDPPKPPDPEKVAAAQTKSNKETAIANAHLNRFDQNSPFGSVNYTIVGTNPDGTPKYQQDTTFSAPVQGMFDNYVDMTTGIGNIGKMQLGQLEQTIGGGFNVNQATEDNLNRLMAARLNPELQRQDEALRVRLANQGIMEGSEAFDRAMERQGRTANDARNQMMLQGRQQALNEAITGYQLPFNTFNAIRNGSQVGMPQQSAFAPVTQQGTNIAGIYSDNYNQQMQAYNAQNAQNNAFMGGLAGIGGSLIGAFF